MDFKNIFAQVSAGLNALDARRKIALAAAFVVILAAVIFISFQASKPSTVPLYSNLTREDMSNMSRILSENGIRFVVSSDQNAIEVVPAMSAKARMLLAENGLPSAESTGYQLFDRVNTLGLTSFMQNVTNKRAIEGELVRTIQMINGVNSARVHLVIEERNLFRPTGQSNSSASVVLKTAGKLANKSINAIRHMVAAAVPGLTSGNVTIVGADGTLLTTTDDESGSSTKLVEMEREYAQSIQEKIEMALGAHIGIENLRVSASVKLNSDKRRVEEVIYDPESRIERSVQVIREAGTTENKESNSPVTIDQNLPEEEVGGGSGQLSSENSERREELTNYEINERKVSLISDGYQVESQSVAVLVNRSRIVQILGGDPGQNELDSKIEELQQIVSSAISIDSERGDLATVTIVDFLPVTDVLEDSSGGAVMAFLGMHLGSILNALGMIVAAVLFSVMGIKPLLVFLTRPTPSPEQQQSLEGPAPASVPSLPSDVPVSGLPELAAQMASNAAMAPDVEPQMADPVAMTESDAPDEDVTNTMARETRLRRQLQQMVEQSEERTVVAIRHWLQQDQTKTV